MQIWLDASRIAHHFIPYSYWLDMAEAMETQYIPRSETCVYEADGAVAGFLSLVKNHVAALFVSPTLQGKGYGTQLLAHAKARHSVLSVCVYKENLDAVKFYTRTGFHVTSERLDAGTSQLELEMEWRQ